ncbi:MAG TPA: hypothetical protein PK689_07200, partial [Kiritimatiellia bacterium]|nr:hypothetical protein [Kiritimatiellia bacterium]
MTSDIHVDPEFESLIPPMTPAERAGLEENLLADGCREPLVVWFERPTCPCGAVPLRNGPASMFRCEKCGRDSVVAPVVLDGHNRLRICTEHGLPYETVEAEDVEDRDGAKAWIIRNQIGRRNLSESQRAMLAASLEEIFGKQAKERQEATQIKDGQPPVCANLRKPSPLHAAKEAAVEMNVSPRLVQAAKKVKTEGSEKLQEAVRSGQASVSAAAQVATLPKKEQDEVVAGGKDQIVQAAKEVRQKRGKQPAPAPADRKKSISADKLAQLQDLVIRLEELASVPQMQISPIHIRR